ncbi:MAG: hypothetical protein HYR74_00465 [Candidatus Eisenbacteria bacterium]|nr:hypothetical protein [Candidatus Eisenbacteria bacterium]
MLALVALAAAGPHALPPSAPRLPAIVFVSRNPIAGERGAIPGFGPHHRAAITGGRLLVREPDGRVRDLLPPGALFDVSHPSVSPDARTIAFAGVRSADDTWRIWAVDLDGGRLRRVTAEAAVGDARADDLDPCWIDATTVVFASTRYRQRAQYADVPVTNLFEVRMPHEGGESSLPGRITSERNGAEKPAMDWKTGKILFARWWFNRWRAATAGGVTDDPAAAVPRDTVNLWQAMELSLDDRRAHVAAADFTTRRSAMGYQPATLADGSIVAVFAANLGLSPRPAGTGIHRLSRSGAPARRLAGAIVPGAAGDAYGGTEGLAPPSACAPAALPDGRIVFSYAPGARGDFGLYAMNADGSRITRVVDLPGTLELDAAPIVTHRAPARRATTAQLAMAPAADTSDLARRAGFRFDDLDVFADGAIARGAAPRTNGARLRFFALLSRPERTGGDTAVMIREAPVGARGVVDERGLPADVPMFEQLIGADGHVLMTAHGPAEVAGSNAGVAGATTRCVGCHLGHSTLPVPATAARPAASRDGARR